MNSFTGNEDTDRLIFLSLNLSDSRKINAPNKYINGLINDKIKMAKKNANDLFNRNRTIFIKTLEPINVFLELMNILKILPNNQYPKSKAINNASTIVIQISKANRNDLNAFNKDGFTITYAYYNNDLKDRFLGRNQYYGNKKQMIEFLTHLYYDQLYDKIND